MERYNIKYLKVQLKKSFILEKRITARLNKK